ncbi:MAG: rhodanese-like domain-containing protein [Fuerstiella sp.]|jgi:phage shock protein E|nr:rhodanese-like domain-containing protein [Fuerstiella sp.]MDG2128854.1 rhodanese-like domain-containing protein [Fuerstiella sp.]
MMRLLLAGVVCCSFCLAADDDPKPPTFTRAGHTTDTLDVVRQRLKDKKAILLDVREEAEWDAGHLKSAKLVPLSVVRTGRLTKQMQKNLPKDKPVYCHCRSGGRVLQVSKILRAKGYDIRPLKAGYEKLVANGFEKAAPQPPAR